MNRSRTPRARRSAAALLAGALALTPGVAAASEHLDDESSPDNVCTLADEEVTFRDLGPVFRLHVECIAGFGIVRGDGTGRFLTPDEVTRGQASEFVTNMLEVALDAPLPEEEQRYDDVSSDGTFATPIGKLSRAGIIDGYDDGTFRPQVALTRGQMARIVHNALRYVEVPTTTADNGRFSDVDGTDMFARDIWGLSSFDGEPQVIDGDTTGRFVAARHISRGEMAKFIAEALHQIDRAGRFAPRGDGSEASFTLDPAVAVSLPDGEERTWTATGLTTDVTYRVVLMDTADVRRSGTRFTFAGDGVAAPVATASAVVAVDGSTLDGDATGLVSADGTLTFTVLGAGPETFTPVLVVEGGALPGLELDEDGRPLEDFGVAGRVDVLAPGDEGDGTDDEDDGTDDEDDGSDDEDDGSGGGGTVVVTAPDLLDAAVTLNGGNLLAIDAGDEVRLRLSDPVDELLEEDVTTLRLRDVGGATFTITCDADSSGDGAASCVDDGTGMVTMTLLDDPHRVSGLDLVPGVQFGATIEALTLDGDMLDVDVLGLVDLILGML